MVVTVRALNSIFQQWGISANQDQWNISGEPCSGAAIDSTSFDNNAYNPFIKCVCSYNNNTLCHITQLKVYALDAVGVIPDELWTLTFLSDLSFGINALSGELPKELGMLTELISLYISSSGVTGEIPSTFANLRNLLTMRASDVELTGRIPDFIGNWSKLDSLRFQGNSFEGPIPSSFSNLTTLTELRISDLSNGSSSLEFIREMKSLSVLELRNNNISDSIPSNIGEYQRLQHLALPFGLNCLQRNFPCNRGAGIYYNFSIKCGGPQITSSNGIVYERDNTTLGPSSYFVTNTSRWGVSNVGYFTGSNNPQYTSFSQSQFTNTLDSELFQTARISASSLRYYGLGLENGNYNVTLQFAEMDILDTTSWESIGRRKFDIYIQGYRVLKDFDIKKEAGGISKRAVQKNSGLRYQKTTLKSTCFGLEKGLAAFLTKEHMDLLFPPSVLHQVSQYLSFFFFFLKFPRNIILSISLLNSDTDFIPTVSNNPPTSSSKTNRTGLIVGIVVGVGLVSFLLAAILWIIQRRKRPSKDDDDEVLQGMDVKPYTFSYAVLKTATEDFSPENKLGEGGFGPVYKAWHLHENNQEVELVDSRLQEFNEEEVKRMIGVALLCTQTLPSLRPPMSRVVAMLCGDIEVSTVTTKPGYLTDWKYDDTTTTGSFMSSTDKANIGTDINNYTSSTTTSMVVVAETQHSAETDTEPILYDNL
ncbi:hypothetical protein LWI28_012972 [Acer negundo]|uniref:non-specific serine/threonine protein kinase n=1 Tax=Acer negundo TaxID=4023 RepID=A0AAD5NIL1_ACENE|nr:hypothetical protein LWI28_012972 [Acer negundo]